MVIQAMDALLDSSSSGTDEGFVFGGSVTDSSILNSDFAATPGAFISLSQNWKDLKDVIFTVNVRSISGSPQGSNWPVIDIVGVPAVAFIQERKLDGIIGVF